MTFEKIKDADLLSVSNSTPDPGLFYYSSWLIIKGISIIPDL